MTCPAPPRPRWEDVEDNAAFQEYSNVGLASAYGLLCAVALVGVWLGQGDRGHRCCCCQPQCGGR